ncbi:hypothetical protein [Nocardioides sp. Root140]|uniref:hypothetical protein n=1 Tax=Nocardioides sp. Root140 TaxID=1736460 RepID=UPI0006FAACD4|nr:hypothetical protein [Nocardioides sp. Root140]KQY64182.1 hypothetical protein ASD30_04280 [Nocardioides sp. Root140]
MRRFKVTLTALLIAVVLLTCADYTTFAATGRSLVLGKVNTADRQTVVARTTTGPVLRLTTRTRGSAPMIVNGTGRVTNLNADRIDGKDASAFAPSWSTPVAGAHVTGALTPSVQHAFGIPAVTWWASNGWYLVTLSQPFDRTRFVPVVAHSCGNLTTSFTSINDKLAVQFGGGVPCDDFNLLVFKLP